MEYFKGDAGPVQKHKYDDPGVLEYAGNEDPFHIGQPYEKKMANQNKCAICGGKEFHIATGDYFTAARCVTCRWELCIHEG